MTTPNPSDRAFWEGLYQHGEDGWDLGAATPPLVRWTAAHPELVDGKRVLVIGCGRGHDARMLARAGAKVTAVDFAAEAVAGARALAASEGVTMEVLQADLFELPSQPEHAGRYDLCVEHTCFCAIDPARRAEYVEAVRALVVDGGHLLALFYAHGRPGGPPFTTDDAELERLFPPRFVVEHREIPPDSLERRRGAERLWLLRRVDPASAR